MPYLFPSGLQALRSFWKIFTRRLLRTLLFFRSEEDKLKAERKLRGRQQYHLLQQADIVLVSFGKSGRTWLRVMLSRVYQQIYGLPEHAMIGFDNFHYMNRAIPRMFFTHDTYIGDYTGHRDDRQDYYDKKVVMLARDPRDVAVSQYFQWKYRMRPHKALLNNYPEKGSDTSIWEFVSSPDVGIPRIVDFFNGWARALPEQQDILIIHYEKMRKEPQAVMREVLAFVGTPGDDDQIAQAVEFASLENMKKLEEKSVFRGSGVRVKAGDPNNPDSFKVRRGKVGGYRDYFDAAQVAEIDAMMAQLDPVFGYATGGNGDSAPVTGSSAG